MTPDQIADTRRAVERVAEPITLALLVWLFENPDAKHNNHDGSPYSEAMLTEDGHWRQRRAS